jgi:polyisoprenoid-binding protein YceI
MTSTSTDSATTQLPTGTWNIDPTHSRIEFSIRHLMISKVKGSFKTFSGTVTVPENPLDASVQVTIDPASIDTGDDNRDNHVRAADFFDVEQYPDSQYVSTAVRPSDDGYVVEGELTFHGVTRPVNLDLEFNGVVGDPWGNTRAGFAASTEVNRRDFGVDFSAPLEAGGVMLGDKIKLSIDVELVLAAPPAS